MQIVFLFFFFLAETMRTILLSINTPLPIPISFSSVVTFDPTMETQLFCKENKKFSSTVTRYYWLWSPAIHLDALFLCKSLPET